MTVLDIFIKNLYGTFTNNEQIKKELKNVELKHPYAKYINGICNDKLKNLNEDSKVVLTSYELPKMKYLKRILEMIMMI